MTIQKSEYVWRFGGRDIIYVMVDGKKQGFYRSSGESSGMPGTWLPFDGIGRLVGIWFDKITYCGHNRDSNLNRFGTQRLKNISDQLGAMDIPQGVVAKPWLINKFLGSRWYTPEFNKWLRTKDKDGEFDKYYM